MQTNNLVEKFCEYKHQEGHVELFREIRAVERYGGGGENKVPLLPDKFIYKLLPDSVRILAITDNKDFFLEECEYEIEFEDDIYDEYNLEEHIYEGEEEI